MDSAVDDTEAAEIAHQEGPRALTEEECHQYLHVNRCPQAEPLA